MVLELLSGILKLLIHRTVALVEPECKPTHLENGNYFRQQVLLLCGKDAPFSHFSLLFHLALVPVSLKSSVNLFLNHQNTMTLGTFPRVVLSPIPYNFSMCVHFV